METKLPAWIAPELGSLLDAIYLMDESFDDLIEALARAEQERDEAKAEANEQRTRADAAEAELANIKLVLREIAQSAITEIGSVGPEDAKDAVARLIKELQALRRQIAGGGK